MRFFTPGRRSNERLLWSRDIRFVNQLAQELPGARLLDLEGGICLIAPALLLTDANANLSAPFGMPITSPPADQVVREGDRMDAAGITLEVLEVPGHSPGHVVFVWRDSPCLVFGGDVLFRGGIGRFDFPGSDGQLLFEGIRGKLFTLPADTVIYPGHGPETTLGAELAGNPFLAELRAT